VEVHCGVLARGSGVVVAHCVFHGCKITAVYWPRGAKGCAMRNTLVTGAYVTGAWICETAGDFEYRNNVVSGCLSAVLFQGPAGKYKLENSLFAGNQHLYGAGLGPAVNFKALPPSTLDLAPSSRVSAKPVEIELDQSKRNYLHVVAGTPGAEIPAAVRASLSRHPLPAHPWRQSLNGENARSPRRAAAASPQRDTPAVLVKGLLRQAPNGYARSPRKGLCGKPPTGYAAVLVRACCGKPQQGYARSPRKGLLRQAPQDPPASS
jgi:hypothetical protein